MWTAVNWLGLVRPVHPMPCSVAATDSSSCCAETELRGGSRPRQGWRQRLQRVSPLVSSVTAVVWECAEPRCLLAGTWTSPSFLFCSVATSPPMPPRPACCLPLPLGLPLALPLGLEQEPTARLTKHRLRSWSDSSCCPFRDKPRLQRPLRAKRRPQRPLPLPRPLPHPLLLLPPLPPCGHARLAPPKTR